MKRFAMLTMMIWAVLATAYAETVLEAEAGRLGAATKVVAHAQASGGKCVVMGSTTGRRVDNPIPSKPEITFEFELDAPGKVTATARILAPTGGNDSLHFSIDGEKIATTFAKPSPQWQEHVLVTQRLAAGRHSVRLYTREPGLAVDSLRVSEKGFDKAIIERYPAPPIVPPAGVHPRVLLRPKHIAAIKARRTQGENATAWEIVASQATDDAVSGELPTESKGRYGNYDARVLMAIQSKALVYALDGDEKRGRQAVALISDFMRTVKFDEGAQDVTRPIGATIYAGALVYDWCYPLMTPAQRKDFIGRFEAMAGTMEIHYPPYGQGAVTSHAGEAQLMRDILCAAIAVYDEYPDMYRMAAGRFFAEFIEARNFFFVSGRHHQGDSYGPYRFKWAIFSAWLFRRLADADIYDKTMQDVPYCWLYMRRPDGQVLRDGDTFIGGPDYWRFPEPIFMTANYYRDPILKGELMRQTGGKALVSDPVLFVLLNDPSIPTAPVDGLPLTRYRGGPLASMHCRTGWSLGYGSPSVVAEFKGAGYQFNNHHHLDAGSFQIYYRGALAMDPGAYRLYGTPYDYGYAKRSISHNMMLVYDPDEEMTRGINDGGMRHPNGCSEPATLNTMLTKGYEVGSVSAHAFGPNPDAPLYSYMRVELPKAYTKKVRAYTRSFCFLNLNDPKRPAAAIVLDDMTTARGDLKKLWLLHTLEKPEVSTGLIDVRRTEGAYNGRLVVSTLLPEKPVMRLVEDKNRTVEVFGKTFEVPGGQVETDGWRVEVSPSVASERDELLHVMQVMDAKGVEPLKVTKLENADLLGVALGDRTVWFARGAEALNKAVEIDVPQAGQVLVAGLKPGRWGVGASGSKSVVAHEVAADNGTLFFIADAAGRYRLSPTVGGVVAKAPDLSGMKPEVRASSASVLMAGKTLSLPEPFARDDGSALIPLRATLALADVEARVEGDTLTARYDERTLTVRVGEAAYRINDRSFPMPAKARKASSDILAPPQAIVGLLRYRFTDFAALGDVSFYEPAGGLDASHWVESVRVVGPPSTNPETNAIDDNMQTMWSCNAPEAKLVLDLGKPVAFSRVGVSWYHGADRKAFFSIEVSNDGKAWERVWDGESSGKTVDLQIQKFDKRTARYMQLVCRGNSSSNWNSIFEVRVLKD